MDKKFLGFLCALLGVLVGSIGFVWLVDIVLCGDYGKGHEPAEVLRDTVIDTIPYYKPVPKDSLVVRYELAKLPIDKGNKPYYASLSLSKAMDDTILAENYAHKSVENIPDSVQVKISITQKRYGDSTYTAWVSGYDVHLDSIYVYPKHEYIMRKIKQPPKKWHIGVTAGYGFGKQGMQPYIGIGLTYSLISF